MAFRVNQEIENVSNATVMLVISVFIIFMFVLRQTFRVRSLIADTVYSVAFSWMLIFSFYSEQLGFRLPADYALLRPRGNDQLVYMSLAQKMLSTGFFRGGEDIYYFQPGIRYVFFLLQAFLGSGQLIIGTVTFGCSVGARSDQTRDFERHRPFNSFWLVVPRVVFIRARNSYN